MQTHAIQPPSSTSVKVLPSTAVSASKLPLASGHGFTDQMAPCLWILMLGILIGALLCGIVAALFAWRRGAKSRARSGGATSQSPTARIVGKFFRRHWLIFFSISAYLIALSVCSYLDPGKGTLHNMIAGVLPFIGTLVGAGVAFMSDRVKEDKRIEDGRVYAINKALHALFAQLNELGMLNVIIQEYKDEHPINLGAIAIPDIDLRVNTDELAFLIDYRHVDIISKLDVEQRRFDVSFFSMRDRNKLIVDVLQPKIAETGINKMKVTNLQLKQALGEYAYGRLITSTKNVFDNVPSTVESCQEVMHELSAIGKELFPHRVILKFGGFNPRPPDWSARADNVYQSGHPA
jgi:hypothetical protein